MPKNWTLDKMLKNVVFVKSFFSVSCESRESLKSCHATKEYKDIPLHEEIENLFGA